MLNLELVLLIIHTGTCASVVRKGKLLSMYC